MNSKDNKQWEDIFNKIVKFALSDNDLRETVSHIKDDEKIKSIVINNYILRFIKDIVSDKETVQTTEIVLIKSVLEVLENRSQAIANNNLIEVDFTNNRYMN